MCWVRVNAYIPFHPHVKWSGSLETTNSFLLDWIADLISTLPSHKKASAMEKDLLIRREINIYIQCM